MKLFVGIFKKPLTISTNISPIVDNWSGLATTLLLHAHSFSLIWFKQFGKYSNSKTAKSRGVAMPTQTSKMEIFAENLTALS